MPAEIFLNERSVELSPEFAYEVTRGGPVQFQAVGEAVEEPGILKVGDVLNRSVAVTASTSGSATLLQYGHDEIAKLNLPFGQATRASAKRDDDAIEDDVSEETTPAKEDEDSDGDGGTAARVDGDTEDTPSRTEPSAKDKTQKKRNG